MAQTSLEAIGVPGPVVEKVRALGIDSPEGLRALIAAAPEDLRRFLGADAFGEVARVFDTIPIEDGLSDFHANDIALGARLDRPPAATPESVDLVLRDRLFSELQALRESPDRNRERIHEVEAKLNALLEGAEGIELPGLKR